MDFLNDLNEAQRAAAVATEGPVMIIAGAGSGKTRTLTYRLAFIIDQGLADPFEILALTFTNKAAREMRERIITLVGPDAKNIWMGTFHSIFARMLRYEAEKLGYTSSFTIYDTDDTQSTLKKVVDSLKLDPKKFKPRVLYTHISSAKNALVDPEMYAAEYVTDSFSNSIARIYKIYQTRLFESNAMDFDDLLMKPIELFDRYPDVLYKWQKRFGYIMVDEYQDTNRAQYVITKKLAAQHENIAVVGDDAQSIYSFRGANIENILNFQKDYPDTRQFKLEQNYRSTKNIVEAANSIIKRNKNQIPKKVFTENATGDLIRILESNTDNDEARMVTDSIREQVMRHSYKHKHFAVLYRTNAQSRALETELRRARIPYKIFGGLSFYRRKEIKDMTAYLKLAVNPRDEAALTRVINYPARGIGKTSMDRLTVAADERGIGLWEALTRVEEIPELGRARKSLAEFVLMIKTFGIRARDDSAYDAANYIANKSGMLRELHQTDNPEMMNRWENVQELLNAAKEFTEDEDNDADKLDAFLAEISLFTDQDEKHENPDFVTLMSIHAAKGLEFPSVFVTGLEEELFPNFMALQSRADLEEERRLFYVAVTRAKDRLALTFAKSRYRYGSLQWNEPSRFLSEVDEEYVHFHSLRRERSSASRSRSGSSLPLRGNGNATPMRSRKRAMTRDDFVGDDLTGLAEGMEVEHSKFGPGKVLKLEGNGSERKATVFFTEKGEKVLLLKYAKLKILS
ncbi:MAG: UvrD-helicase domain-containing protein [Bacteroidota bacterium]